uniref:restriction endonuclease subunit S n=1 Tax=Tissierella praeacuta TaxID=43131 RepID=UPI003341130F
EQNIEYDLFDFSELFEYENEQKYDALKTVNLVSALTKNNGVKEKVITDTYIQGNKLSISTNGIYTGTAFYQEEDFILQDSISVSLKNKELNKYIGMYLITVINYENFRFDYGRKSGKSRLNRLKLRLPINDYGNPDYDYMERYIKTLEFSKYI